MKQYKEYKDSGVKWIGKIPSHWKAVQLRRITATVRTGTTPSGVSEIYFDKTGLCWFTPSDFENNYVLLDSEKHLSALGEKKVKIFREPSNQNILWSDDNEPIFEGYNLSKEDFFHLSIEYDNILTPEQIDILREIMRKRALNKNVSVYATPVMVAGLVPWKW